MANEFKNPHLRVPPHNLDSEKALLGAIMLKPEAMHDIFDILAGGESFYSEKHRLIWKAIFDLFEKKEPVDMISLSARLKERGLLEQIGGGTFLAELVSAVPSAANAKHYAEMIRKKFVLRNLIDAGAYVSEIGYDEHEELETTIDRAGKKMFSATSMGTSQKFIALKDVIEETRTHLAALQASDHTLRGVPTGFADLDNKLSGLQNSDLIILAARPSMGKTALALDIARQAAVGAGLPVGIFSLEMSHQQLIQRMLSSAASVDSWRLRTGRLQDDELDNLQNSLDILRKAPIYMDDQSDNTILSMRSVARRMKQEHDIKLIIVDYLQLINPGRSYDSMVNQITEISRALKGIARELNIPVLALSQLSRAAVQDGGKPKLHHLRDSGSIEQDADVVMFIHREKDSDDPEKARTAEILIEKHRNGPTGRVELIFDDKRTTFRSKDGAHASADPLDDF